MSEQVTITITVSRTEAAFIMMLLSFWKIEYPEWDYAPELRLLPDFIRDIAMALDEHPVIHERLSDVAQSQKWSPDDQDTIRQLLSIIGRGVCA